MENKTKYYLTFNESLNGIYQSQVVDVLNFYKKKNINFKLIAFISIKSFLKNRKKLKLSFSSVIVIPSYPKLKNWKINIIWFYLFCLKKDSFVICRGIFSTNLALSFFKKNNIIYDGRGAINAEQIEYGVYNNTGLENKIYDLEKRAVLDTDYRIAVSTKLIDYWIEIFDYSLSNHTVIPCTYSSHFDNDFNLNQSSKISNSLDLYDDQILCVYSGSVSKWQSFSILNNFITDQLEQTNKIKFLFLCEKNDQINLLLKNYPNYIFQKKIPHEEVLYYLDVADYGLLLREESITNTVASPVKFAEYLSRGLKVLISNQIGDYSDFVNENKLGLVIDDKTKKIDLLKVSKSEKNRVKQLSNKNFSKQSVYIRKLYLNLIKL